MKRAYIKNKKEFDKVATEYGFVKKYVGEVNEQWSRRIGSVEIFVFNLSNKIYIFDKDLCITNGKKRLEKFVKDISHLIEWR